MAITGRVIPADGVIIDKRTGKLHIINPGKIRNISQGFIDASGRFHPIRASDDYSPSRADEKKTKKRKAVKKSAKKKAVKKVVKKKKSKSKRR